MNIAVSVRKVVFLLVAIAAVLAILTVVAQVVKDVVPRPAGSLYGFGSLLDVKKEESIHTWYSEVLLLSCSVLLAIVWRAKKRAGDRYATHWAGLAGLLLFLSVDDGAQIHERFGLLGKQILRSVGASPTGPLTYSWVVPAFILVLLVVLVYARFFFGLRRREKLLFSLSAALFVGGAIFLEMTSAYYVSLYGGQKNMGFSQDLLLIFVTTAEEMAEVAATIVLIYALLTYLRPWAKDLTFSIKD